ILMSETTRALLGNALPDRTTVRDLGLQSLKDLGEERIFQLTLDGRDDFAPLKTEGGLSRSAANVLGDDFDQRIEDFVKASITGAFPRAAPPEPPSKPFWSRFGRRSRR